MTWLRRPASALGRWLSSRPPRAPRSRLPWAVLLLLVLFGAGQFLWLQVHVPSVDQGLEAIRESGTLTVLSRPGPTTRYEGANGLTGFEYEMMQRLGKSLGVAVEFRIYQTEQALVTALAAGKGHLAAAGLAVTEARKAQFGIGPTYQSVRQLLICHRDGKLPKKPSDLKGLRLAAAAGTAGSDALAAAIPDLEAVSFRQEAQPAEELLARVAAGILDCAVADSLVFKVVNPYHPELAQAFELTGEQPLAWLTAPGSEDLKEPLRLWYAGAKKSGLAARLERNFLGFLPRFDYVDLRAFSRAVEERLPDYEKLIRRAARENGLSWQLLAAIAYQESHWNPDAKSPTGVRGFMMLTRQTAEQLGVENRLDPAETIAAAARYLADLKSRIPVSVEEPDRTWFALAAWNLGLGHVYDARKLALRQGRDRDSWEDLRRVLPLLNNAAHAGTLKHGPARGGQAVHFVQQVRTYMHILEAGTGT